MKRSGQIIIALASFVLVTGCGKLKDNNNTKNGGGTVTLPQPPSEICMQTANPRSWQPYFSYGFRGYQSYAGYSYGQPGFYVDSPAAPHYHHRHRRPQPHPGHVFQHASHLAPNAAGVSYVNAGSGGNSSVYHPNQGFCGCPTGYIPVCDNSIGMGCALNTSQRYATWHWNQTQGQYYRGNFGQFNAEYAGANNSCYSGFGITCRVGSMDCGTQSICMQSSTNSTIGVCVGM